MDVDQTLTTFRDLLRTSPLDASPGDAQDRAAAKLPGLVAASRMNWWSPGQHVPESGCRLLVGVVVWSGYDMRLLDFVEAGLARPPCAGLRVDVFDADTVLPPASFESYVPGLGEAFQTPIVGIWVDGVLRQQASGFAGRKLVADLFGFDMKELSQVYSAVSHR